MNYSDVLSFWFNELQPKDWFNSNEHLDLKMVSKFIVLHSQAVNGELFKWRDDPYGRLAEIIIIDQFSRNIYRDDQKSFLYDPLALILAQEVLYGNHHKSFYDQHKMFLYTPFMHSESPLIHEKALILLSEPGMEKLLAEEIELKKTIDRFGRFPERNSILSRLNTPEEEVYLFDKESHFHSTDPSHYSMNNLH